MARRRLFTIVSPLGYRVFLTRDRWRQITRYKHPTVATHQNQIRACLQSPVLIRESSKDSEVHLYYAPSGEVHVCVVVAPAVKNERFVVTAYFTENIKKGKELLWKS